jgi:hypothetical protein
VLPNRIKRDRVAPKTSYNSSRSRRDYERVITRLIRVFGAEIVGAI